MQAHLGFPHEAHVVMKVALVMQVGATAGFATSWFGRGYGRVSSCFASVLVFFTWWLVLIPAHPCAFCSPL
jgi:hypothetical protein